MRREAVETIKAEFPVYSRAAIVKVRTMVDNISIVFPGGLNHVIFI